MARSPSLGAFCAISLRLVIASGPVVGTRGLAEKIRVFDCGLDDYALVALKLLLVKQFDSPEEIFFEKEADDSLVFWVCYDDSSCDKGVMVSRKYYETIFQFLENNGVERKVFYVDMQLMAQYIADFGKGN